MRLYKTTARVVDDQNEGGYDKAFRWDGTQADARARRKEMSSTGVIAETEEVDVPTDKAGLLAFLNENCTGN